MKLDGAGLEVLDAPECLQLICSHSMGRIALTSRALPVVLPVNYVVHDDHIVIRTRRGTALSAATRNAIVAFEVDQFDDESGVGWSVMVQGVASELHESFNLELAGAVPLARWLDQIDSRLVGISVDVISGRRIPRIEVPDDIASVG